MGDSMNTDFVITKIYRIVMVDKNEYREKVTAFDEKFYNNEMIFHFSGKATVYFNDEVLHTSENTVRFLPKGEASKYVVDREEHGECILINFDANMPITDEAFVINIKNVTALGNLFKKAFSLWVSKSEGYYFECMSILYKIFAHLQKESYIPLGQYNTIKPAFNYIEENFLKEKISVANLAKECGVSDSYLKKLFIKKCGLPPVKYIIQLKINYACDLLRSKMYSITQISEMCGYNSVQFFTRQFKEYSGISPTDFINKYKSSK